ncbi:MAG: hypothetical protein HY925_12645 [Elusimicrobia bacterium]|nr:hypothetical protein [Elusimicrobiota bacterium]
MRGFLLIALLAGGAFASEPIKIVSVESVKVPWNSTRNSWEETKEIAGAHWRAIPFAQIAAAMFLVKTGLSAPYDLVAAPFRQKSRSEVAFEIAGKLVDGDGHPVSNAKLTVRCTTPLEVNKRGYANAYYESERYGAETDGDGRLALKGTGLTGASPRFMIHLDVEEGPKGSGSAGAYSVVLSSADAAEITLDVKGAFHLTAD